ncbi:flagellar protein FlaG [Pseudomonas sp.]|jgi:flagellar protein FlaG|uniref:flagellar protein FlaG n=1 Tax=Pseudomonas sp. TaxID=306 RepID=UPI0028A82844|nr:flagellar protein FlaG [Pseudomonas sp.]
MNIITPNLQYGTSKGVAAGTESKASSENSVVPTTASAKGAGAVDRDQLDSAVASMQDYAQSVKRNLDFHIDDSTGRVVVQVIASDSGELIRQIPSEEVLELAASLDDVRSLMFREQA